MAKVRAKARSPEKPRTIHLSSTNNISRSFERDAEAKFLGRFDGSVISRYIQLLDDGETPEEIKFQITREYENFGFDWDSYDGMMEFMTPYVSSYRIAQIREAEQEKANQASIDAELSKTFNDPKNKDKVQELLKDPKNAWMSKYIKKE